MTTEQEQIAFLAGIEVECDASYPDMLPRVHAPNCYCNGTGKLIPFEFLRLYKEGIWSHGDCPKMARWTEGYCDLVSVGSRGCGGRGWLPLDNIKEACWWLYEWHQALDNGAAIVGYTAYMKALANGSELTVCVLEATLAVAEQLYGVKMEPKS
tara:strand:+ start:2906 stop:3367 length:462 start_codon:yes stop_codon:yes gene_type:complete